MSALANDPYLSKSFRQDKPASASSRASITYRSCTDRAILRWTFGIPLWLDNILTASITDQEVDAVCRRDYNVVSTNYGFSSAFLAKSEHARGRL